MKVCQEQLTGFQTAAIRIFSAGLVFLPFAVFHISQIPKHKIFPVILSGLLGNLLPAFLFAVAIEKKIDSSLAGILNSLTPLFVIVIAILFFKAHLQVIKIAGVLIGFVGLLILTFSSGGISTNNFTYSMLILFATILYGLNINIVNYYLKDIDPIKIATVSLPVICIPTIFILWKENILSMATYDSTARVSIIYAALLGIIGTAFATALFYLLIKRAGGLFASLVTYGIPVIAIFWGFIAHEKITSIQISCLALILAGVYIANKN
jgi:drug/metabolite transporter (DMT)-like permease